MTFEERTYRTLVVSSSEKFNENLVPLLSPALCEPVTFADSVSAAKRLTLETQFDFVIINAPLPDETGTKFAIDVSSGKSTVCLLLARAELYPEIRSSVTSHGVFTLSKPLSSSAVANALSFLAAARERLRKLEKKSLSIEEKMEEIRLVNRAKWLLIERESLTEADAHRLIEKQAMNRCITKSEVAREIIERYPS